MSISVRSLQSTDAQIKTEQTVQPPPKPQTTPQASAPQDKVTISDSAKQALATNAKEATGETKHDGG